MADFWRWGRHPAGASVWSRWVALGNEFCGGKVRVGPRGRSEATTAQVEIFNEVSLKCPRATPPSVFIMSVTHDTVKTRLVWQWHWHLSATMPPRRAKLFRQPFRLTYPIAYSNSDTLRVLSVNSKCKLPALTQFVSSDWQNVGSSVRYSVGARPLSLNSFFRLFSYVFTGVAMDSDPGSVKNYFWNVGRLNLRGMFCSGLQNPALNCILLHEHLNSTRFFCASLTVV